MVGALTLVAVRQQQHDAGLLAPLGLARREILVDDGLGTVDEVAELGLPDRERLGACHRVAVLEAERGVLAEQRVVDEERRLVLGDVGQRGPLVGVLAVDDRGEARRERAAARVLAGHADRTAVEQQRAHRQDLARAPVDRAGRDRRGATLQLGEDLRVDREALRHVGVRVGDRLEHLGRDRRLQCAGELGLLRVVRGARVVEVGVLGVLDVLEVALQAGLVVGQRGLGLLHRDVATTDEGLGVQLAHRLLLLDRVVHQRLGERRVVALVVTAAAVADEADDDVLVERLAVLVGERRDADAGLRVVAVDVEDRRLDHAGDVGAVRGRARRGRARGEADLVVDDDVDRAAGAVPAQLRQVERLGHDALAGERGVTVHEDRQHRELLAAVEDVLLGAGDALEHRVDDLEVRRVGRDGDLDRVAVLGGELALDAQVVLDVAGALHGARVDVALELAEDRTGALAGDVDQHVEAAAVGHADADLLEAVAGGLLADLVEQRDRGLATLEAEALLADELGLQERLERLGLVELGQDAELLLARRLGVAALEALLEPATLGRVLDVHVLGADRARVRVAQDAEDLTQLHVAALAAERRTGGELAVEVPQREAVRRGVEVGVAALLVLQRVGVGHEVTADPERVDELQHAGLTVDVVVVADGDVLGPADRLVRDAQGLEDLVVEALAADEQLVHALEELAGLRALDDAVVVGGGQRHHLADRHLRERVLGRTLELRRVLHRADADDDALAGHEARHRVVGADAARVGERDGGALEVGDLELAVARLLDHDLVGLPELREVHGLGGLDARHEQLTAAIGLLQVDREAEVDVLGLELDGLALVVGLVARVHLRQRGDGTHDGVADDVRERDLAAAGAGEVVVHDRAVVEEQLDRHGADRGGGGDREARVHVLGGAGGGASQHDLLDLARIGGRRGRRGHARGGGGGLHDGGRRLGDRRLAGAVGHGAVGGSRRGARGRDDRGLSLRRGGGRRLVRGRGGCGGLRGSGAVRGTRAVRGGTTVGGAALREEVGPLAVDGLRVGLVALEHLLHEPLIGPEVGLGGVGVVSGGGLGHGPDRLFRIAR